MTVTVTLIFADEVTEQQALQLADRAVALADPDAEKVTGLRLDKEGE